MPAPVLTLEEVAEIVGGRLVGPGAVKIRSIAPVEEAGSD